MVWAKDVLDRCKKLDIKVKRVAVDMYSPGLAWALPRLGAEEVLIYATAGADELHAIQAELGQVAVAPDERRRHGAECRGESLFDERRGRA